MDTHYFIPEVVSVAPPDTRNGNNNNDVDDRYNASSILFRRRADTVDKRALQIMTSSIDPPSPPPPRLPPPPIPHRSCAASAAAGGIRRSSVGGGGFAASTTNLLPYRPSPSSLCLRPSPPVSIVARLVRTLRFDKFMTNKWISGLAVTGKKRNRLVVVDLREAFLVDADDGQLRRSIGARGEHRLVEPIDVCVLPPDGRLAVSDHRAQDVKVYTGKGQHVATVADAATLTNIAGVAANADGELFVAATDKKCVSVHSFSNGGGDGDDGRFLYRLPPAATAFSASGFVVSGGDAKLALFDHPYSVAVNPLTGDVIVGDDYRQVVSAVSAPDGRLQWRFCPAAGGGHDRHFFPSSIAVDADGYVFVADLFDKKVYMLDSGGRLLRTLLSCGVGGGGGGTPGGLTGAPGAIAVDDRGQLYVADEEKTVKVFKYGGDDGFTLCRRTNDVIAEDD